MKVLFAALLVLVSLAMTKGNSVKMMWNLMCSNKEDPKKLNELRRCIGERFQQQAGWLPGAIRDCEYSKFSYGKFEEFVNEMCNEDKDADMEEVLKCISDKIEAAEEDLDFAMSDIIKNCY
ncbi:uncharacterized protein LOC111089240 isoform X1 [Limulus polyphemus]|uniref:Uncharacterized protein LOC111089240 isoform X1 n=1 Tax=Limulus polyphemus TaxID=6850 RepID=A0ABM1TMI2_LIMPO|nr:uncharacterized protein LOC111089240 isoform X1 [Limulus polyphemus]